VDQRTEIAVCPPLGNARVKVKNAGHIYGRAFYRLKDKEKSVRKKLPAWKQGELLGLLPTDFHIYQAFVVHFLEVPGIERT
jgi:hypothetical protein